MLSCSDADDASWDEELAKLPGATLYQSASWGRYRAAAGWKVMRVVGRDGKTTTIMAQLLVRRRMGMHVVWLPGGPAGDMLHGSSALKSLLRRHFGPLVYCRINALNEVMKEAALPGWRRPSVRLGSRISLELDLSVGSEVQLSGLTANWRHNLRRAWRPGLIIEPWIDPDPDTMAAIYRVMEDHKGLRQQYSARDLDAMIKALGERLIIFRCCDSERNLLAFRAGGVFAGRAWDLLAAATPAARKVYASYAALWALLEACKQQGAKRYDLGGVDPVANKGVFDFKRGTGARPIEYLGEWEWSGAPLLSAAVGLKMKHAGLDA